MAASGAGRSGYLPPLPVSSPAPVSASVDDEQSQSETTADEGPLTVVRNPLIDLLASRPSRAARLAKIWRRPASAPKLSLATGDPLSPRRALSPRARKVSPR
jgi:hypothetical protein